ncbi:universal stress protein [Archangium lansingense]|uniref:Universal stress protein n=1 Tax=Archangium lansingense TaxID=2995310 RepID=A0ABT4A164_9BACT|nr:universal stress protein [Archangium lansinium]MCY1074737.1 universal stress protein [Archangium lansinium]
MIHHILVAIDGSETSRKAARFAHDLAQQTGSRITLLFVLEPPRMLSFGFLDSEIISGPQRSPEELDSVRRMLDEVASDLPKAQVEKVVEIGRPADTIVAMSDKLGADHIVIGARGLNPGGKWLLGSVSDRVVQHAGRPVTVVH